jgi:hypothetical protein
MDLISEREAAAIEARLNDLDDDATLLPPDMKQLLVDANTLMEQLYELQNRWARVVQAVKDGGI